MTRLIGPLRSEWRGWVSTEKTKITLSFYDRMVFTVKVGLIRRLMEWSRVSEVPPAPNGD